MAALLLAAALADTIASDSSNRVITATIDTASRVDSQLVARLYKAAHGASAWTLWPWVELVMVFGALVGASEIISRYRDDPWKPFSLTSRTPSAGIYVLVNAGVAAATFLFIHFTDVLPKLGTPWQALVSGFGAMVLLRSKLLTIRTGSDEDIPI